MFRRSKSDTPPVPDTSSTHTGATRLGSTTPSGKGRPTPTRKEAEAAARARAKATLDPKAARRGSATTRGERSREIRAGIKRGDERYLPARDQGPVKRFVRDYVDHRLCLGEFAIPLLFASLVFSSAGYATIGSAIINAILLMVVVDTLVLRWRLRREIGRRFPNESAKGVTLYAFMRALQVRFLRLPKPQVRLGQQLPERY